MRHGREAVALFPAELSAIVEARKNLAVHGKTIGWSEVDQKRGHVEVKARKAKSARRRVVEVQPNLAEWLRPYAEKSAVVVAPNWRKKLDAVARPPSLRDGRKMG